MDINESPSQTTIEQEIPASAILTPPSIHHEDLIVGASYAHYTPIPSLITLSKASDVVCEQGISGTECCLGIDEAGRGPVLGPMVYGAFYLPIEIQHSLLAKTHHFDDSKVLTPAFRANLMKVTCTPGTDLFESCGWAMKSLSARDIGAGMLKNGGSYNLNAQAMDATIEIIRGVIDRGVNIREIFVDTIGIPEVYEKKLQRVFPTVKVRVEKKADSLFPCVSAASVVAKVTRDVSCELLYEQFAKEAGLDTSTADRAAWGSGYPSDVRCTKWLKSELNPLFGWGSECRFSWGTVKDMLELKTSGATKTDWPADQDEDNMRMSDYFVTETSSGVANTEVNQLRSWFGSSVGQEAF